ncbi:MAG: peptide-methionine (S)-S-oxide reductase MsrA [Bacteroidetes bacterium]|nr:peptide-methionine (S)-S-oxide reductase MsrA [Bacteroidota bacterium]
MEKATFGAGCFWGIEEMFRQLPGVTETAVGYSGGQTKNPTYHEVCSKHTGHAEVVSITFDPTQVTYAQLLDIFWNNHNPTTPNRQGPDVGSQYRSVIFYHSESQKTEAEASLTRFQARLTRPIVTEITPACTFYRAEEYHQQYLEKRGLTHCHL